MRYYLAKMELTVEFMNIVAASSLLSASVDSSMRINGTEPTRLALKLIYFIYFSEFGKSGTRWGNFRWGEIPQLHDVVENLLYDVRFTDSEKELEFVAQVIIFYLCDLEKEGRAAFRELGEAFFPRKE